MSQEIEFEATIEIDEEEVEVEVVALYTPGFPGKMYNRYGDPGDPPEPAEVEIISVTRCDTRHEISENLPDYTLDSLAEKCPCEE